MGTIFMSQKQTKRHYMTIGIMLLSGLLLSTGGFLQPREATAATITCSNGLSGCHFTSSMVKDGTARNVPAGQFLGSHARHSGYSTASKRQYQFACTKCHPSASYTNSHQSGYKNITGSSLPGSSYSAGKKIANTNTPAFGNCNNIYCHSTGRATGMGQVQYSSVRWGGTETCLGCHGGRSTTSPYNPARSVGNFTLSTSHSQHLKYPVANVNCQICHSKTATNATTLKDYTGVKRHANGVRDVTFTGLTYGNYTAYKSTEAGSIGNTKKCNNTSCHGGTTRAAWSSTAQNIDNTCVHCHGTAGTVAGLAVTGTNRYNLRFFAPGWPKNSQGTASAGISTDGITINTNDRVGAHFVHLSSAYTKNIKCNECHAVPSTPFEGTHMATTARYNSQTLTFAQASTAIKNTTTTAKVDGTPTAAATCTTTYCHGSNMPKGDTSGSARSPAWDNATLMTGSPGADCGTCHGNPPTAGTTATTHSGKTATTSCSGCHGSVVDSTGKIINKDLHINGTVQATAGDCMGCHNAQTGSSPTKRAAIVGGTAGSEGDDFIRKSRHVSNGTTTSIVTNLDCIICHAEGDTTSTSTTPKTNSTYHGGDGGNKTVDLRDVDSTNGATVKVAWPGTRLTATNGAFTATATQRDSMDSFCMGCHDSNGSSQIAVNGTNTGMVLGTAAVSALARGTTTANFRPFNTNDTLANANDTLSTLRATFNKVLNVKDQFNSGNATGSAWASHHNLNQFTKRYTSRNTTAWGNTAWVNTTTKDGVNLQTAGETAGLHCSDCHLNEVNAHGSRSTWYMLMDKNGADTAWTNSMTGTMVCFKCHSNTDYGAAGTGSRFTHSGGDINNFGGTGENYMNIVCLNCHGGYTESTSTGFGAIHGNNDTYTTAGGTTKRYRFMSGAAGRYFYPTASLGGAPNWTTSTDYGCYTVTAADSWGGCTKHAGGALGSSKNATRRTRALDY